MAGGSGSRMNSEQPKQFLVLEDRPILMHTIDAFNNYSSDISIIVVLPKEHISTWENLVSQYLYKTPHQITIGGVTRFDSVQSGLSKIVGEGLVAIHDGARPLISTDVIERTFHSALKQGNGIAAVQVKDSIRKMNNEKSEAVDRNLYYSVQTPQTFTLEIIRNAFENAASNAFTDDASVVEAFGKDIHLVEGSYENLKITTPEDLVIAASILQKRHKNT